MHRKQSVSLAMSCPATISMSRSMERGDVAVLVIEDDEQIGTNETKRKVLAGCRLAVWRPPARAPERGRTGARSPAGGEAFF